MNKKSKFKVGDQVIWDSDTATVVSVLAHGKYKLALSATAREQEISKTQEEAEYKDELAELECEKEELVSHKKELELEYNKNKRFLNQIHGVLIKKLKSIDGKIKLNGKSLSKSVDKMSSLTQFVYEYEDSMYASKSDLKDVNKKIKDLDKKIKQFKRK